MGFAGCVVVGGIWGDDEVVANGELLVGKVAGFPDCEAGWVAVPVVVGLSDVAEVV